MTGGSERSVQGLGAGGLHVLRDRAVSIRIFPGPAQLPISQFFLTPQTQNDLSVSASARAVIKMVALEFNRSQHLHGSRFASSLRVRATFPGSCFITPSDFPKPIPQGLLMAA